ncbi:MAG: sigma-70 family RNA polymerase sigma factor [Planctomycetes bacterium]|nr:sigma-70 family RNA polymerase sigma factor [Planctomycetota bacterium]
MAAPVESPEIRDEQWAACVARREESPEQRRTAQDALRTLYDRHAPSLLAFLAARVPRDDVEDVHQAIWERVWERLPDSFHTGNFRAWLFQVARNYLIDRSRRRRPELLAAEHEAFLADGRGDDPAELLVERERRDLLRGCLMRLEAPLAEVVRSRLAGEEYGSICRRMKITTPQAHKMLHRAKNLLHACVNKPDR